MGLKFRRQHPVNKFIVDFYFHKRKLIIELDGGIHEEATQKENDIEREKVLTEMGLVVIRFKNEEVNTEKDLVKKKILEAIKVR
jgi:very-short-patch-repair endonuclease